MLMFILIIWRFRIWFYCPCS